MTDSQRVVSFPAIRELESEAVAWIVKLDSGDLSEQERKEFKVWKASSQHHREALQRASEFWGGLDCLREFETLTDRENNRGGRRIYFSTFSTFSNFSTPVFAGALAASLLVAVLFVWQTLLLEPDATQRYVTGVGKQQTIELADNSSILLNTNSEVEVSYTGTQRSIRLLKGEAHFEVEKDPARPFVVSARDLAVAAVGTAFSVRLFETKLEVTVTEGQVRVDPVQVVDVTTRTTAAAAEQKEQRGKTPPPALLNAGQNAVFDRVAELIEDIPAVEMNRKLAWHQGILVFEGETLEQVVESVARYTKATITINDPSIRDLPVVGIFKVGEIEALFEALEQSLGLQVSKLDNEHIVISEP